MTNKAKCDRRGGLAGQGQPGGRGPCGGRGALRKKERSRETQRRTEQGREVLLQKTCLGLMELEMLLEPAVPVEPLWSEEQGNTCSHIPAGTASSQGLSEEPRVGACWGQSQDG